MKKTQNTTSSSRRMSAFSLIEISLSILIIGILIAGVTQGSRLVTKARVNAARSLTQSSPVHAAPNLIAWFETSFERSFDDQEEFDGSTITNWYDVNPTSGTRNNATQVTTANKPKLTLNGANGLPLVTFDGSTSFLNLPNGTVPFGNSSYTVFFVIRPKANSGRFFLSSGTWSTSVDQSNYFQYSGTAPVGRYGNSWGVSSTVCAATCAPLNTLQVVSFVYANAASVPVGINGAPGSAYRRIYVNGGGGISANKEDNPIVNATMTVSRNSTNLNNYIGRSNSPTTLTPTDYFSGDIGEIIIFDRNLKPDERRDIEKYLGKKWGVRIS